tara:strand:- start:30137 stop:30508 length:372 start_codon:yes stop_codon:yes gene_type:complete
MSKKKLTEIAEEYEISFEKAQDFVTNNLEEEMVTGRGKGTWVNNDGQEIFEQMIPINILYRGKVMQLAPNPRYVLAHIKELGKKVPVKVPLRFSKGLLGKVIHIEANNKGDEPTYEYRKTKMS